MSAFTPVSLLAACLALVLATTSGCRKDSTVPRALIERALDQALPDTKGLDLTYELEPDENGTIEVRCKFRRQRLVTTFRVAERKQADGMMDQVNDSEFLRGGLVVVDPPKDARIVALIYDPKKEPLLTNLGLLEPVEIAGSTFEDYGRLYARKFVDRWEISPFETKSVRAGRTLEDFRGPPADGGLRQRLFGRGKARYFVLETKEWGEHLAEAGRA